MMNTRTVVYVACTAGSQINAFTLELATGELGTLQSLATPGQPTPLRASPDQRLLYAGTRTEYAVLAYAIDPGDGRLNLKGTAPAPARSTYVACDPAQRVLFSASYGDHCLSLFPLDAEGLPRAATQIEHRLAHAHAALVDASGRWLLVPLLGADAIAVYRLHNGRITAHTPPRHHVRAGSGPRHALFSADNRRLHCLNELDGSIDLFDFDADNGQLNCRQSVSMLPPGFSGKAWAAEIKITPDGRWLYASERTSSTIAVFAVDPRDGRLSLFGHCPAESQPRGMSISPDGRWLVVAGELSNRLCAYSIDPSSGLLTAGKPLDTAAGPSFVEIVSFTH